MKTTQRQRWFALLKHVAAVACYLIFAKVGLFFALQSPQITIFWPAGGFAIALLLLGGRKYLPDIFIGAVIAGYMAVDNSWAATLLGVADTVESFAAYWLLTRYCAFNPALDSRRDFFNLILIGGSIASAISTCIGPVALMVTQVIPAQQLPQVAMRWWMGDVLGIAFMAPLILIWSRMPRISINKYPAAEAVILLGVTFLVGQIVFFNWYPELTEGRQGVAWIYPLVIWSGLRTGRHVTSVLQLMLFTQALWSAKHGMGSYADDMARNGLNEFWIFGMVLAVGGMALAVMAAENKKVQKEWQRLHKTIAASLNEIYMFSADTLRFFFVNRGAMQNLGYSMEELQEMTPLDLKPFFTWESFQELVAPLKRHESSALTFETMHKRKDGSLYPVEVHLQLFEDMDGNYFQAILLDITERLAAEQGLRLAAQVLENITDGIEITDADNRIVSINRAFTRISGYTEDEVMGKHPGFMGSGMHDKEFFQDMWAAINRNNQWQGEIWNRRKNGEIYPQWLSISVIRDTHGKPMNYIGIFADITARKNSEDFLKHQAHHDFLTNLPNRKLFQDRLQQQLARARRNHEAFALLYLDLNDFKPINDTYGHHVGDLLLQAVATRLTEATRETDTVSRQGGDEFTILVPGIETESQAHILADKVMTAIGAPYLIEGISMKITVSIGIAVYPQHGADEATLMAHADEAMYQAKRSKRNSVQTLSPASND